MRKILLTFCITFTLLSSYAQINGTKNIPGNYSTLADAIADLNSQGVGEGGIVLNLLAGNPETAPAGGFVIGGAGSAVLTTSSSTQQIIIQGNGNTITASAAHTVGAINDAIFKLIGADWVTITGFTLVENSANTVTAAATNTMTEFGIALFYVTTTDGAQNNTISNNTIDLDRTYQNTFGIYSNSTHSSTAMTTVASASGAAGGNSGLTIIGNTITDVNLGIVVVGPTAAADFNEGLMIGGSLANGNNITNFGTTGTFSGYVNVSGTVNGILVRNTRNFVVSYNSVVSSDGGTTAGTLNGIQVPAFSAAPTGTFTNSINNNSISLRSGIGSGAINGINVGGTSASSTSTININNNDFYNFGHTTGTASGTIIFITQGGTHLNQSISNNTFTNNTVNTTGSVTFISNSHSLPAGGIKNVNGNSIVTGFSKTGGGGTVTLFTDNGSDPSGTVNNTNNNNFSNITVTGATTIAGISNTNGGSPTKSVSGNTLANWAGGTSPITVITINWDGATATISGNMISNITNGGAITGISLGSSGTGIVNVSENGINTLAGSGAGAVNGITVVGGTIRNVYKNRICNLENTNAGGLVNGLLISAGTTVTAYNNIIGDLRAPNLNAANSLIGISVTGGTTVNLYYNTVYLNAVSEGALFGSSALSASTTPTLDLRNNIFVNLSTPNGATGYSSAYRRSSTTLTTYSANSNNNLFYAGTPGANNLIFFDGTNSDQTLTQFKTRVAPRDAASVSENPPFLSTTCGSADFLKINPAIATQIESGAVRITSPIAITTDYFGTIRAQETGYAGTGILPDIGAHEGDFTALDLVPPAITYTPLANTAVTTARNLVVTVIDFSGVPTTAPGWPHLYWKKTGDAGYTAVAPSNVSGSNYTFSFGAGTTLGDVVEYYVVAQDNASPPNVGAFPSGGAGGFTANPPAAATPPTNPSSYQIVGSPLSGDYTVGLAAFNRITGRNVTFQKVVSTVLREVQVEVPKEPFVMVKGMETLSPDESIDCKPQTTTQLVEVEEITWVPFEDGKVLTEKLFAGIDENPGLVFPRNGRGVYATITEAINDLNLRGVSSNVNFLLTDASYTTGETFPIVVNIANENLPSQTKQVTLKPDTDVVALIQGSSPNAQIFRIMNSYFNIDGSNSGGSDRSLTIENTSTTSPQAILIGSLGTNPISGVKVKNSTIINGAQTSSAIMVSDAIASETPGYFNNIVLQNLGIKKAYIGIYCNAVPSGENGNGLLIENNQINYTGADGVRLVGVYVQGAYGATVNYNTISLNNTIDASNVSGIWFATGTTNSAITNNTVGPLNGTAGGPRAIIVSSGNAPSNILIQNNVIAGVTTSSSGTSTGITVISTTAGVTIEKNRISNIKNTNTGGWGCNGIWLASTSTSSTAVVKNNFIYDVASYGYASAAGVIDNGYGIIIASGAGYEIYHNSVLMSTNQSVNGLPAAFNITSGVTAANAVTVLNNIFSNIQTVGTNRYAAYIGASNTVLADINYNCYYTTGPNLGYIGGVNRVDLTAWRTGTGKDLQSVSGDPQFLSNTDLHINPAIPSPVDNAGFYLASVTDDIDGDVRQDPPDIGADEYTYTPPACPIPTSLTTTNITSTSAILNWVSGGVLFKVKYNQGSNFDPNTSGTSVSPDPVTNSCSISGLTPGQNVFWYVKNVCSEVLESDWVGPASFTTQLVSPIPYFEGFATETTPAGWNITGWTIGTTTAIPAIDGNYIRRNLWSNATTGVFTTVNIGTVATGMLLTFDYALANYSSPYAPPAAGSGNYVVSISIDYGVSYSILETVVNDGVAGWREKIYNLSAYDGENVKIKIEGNRTAGDYWLAFDNFKVETPPVCPAPTVLTATNLTPTTADLGWTPGGTETLWHVEVGAPGFTPGTGTALLWDYFTPNNPWLASPLTPATDYEFYVKAYCNGFDNPRIGNFWVTMGEVGDLREGGGTFDPELQENGEWYLYEDAPGRPWWNIWWYNDPLDLTRMKKIRVGFWVTTFEPEQPGLLEYVVNWSTPAWVTPPLPLPGFPLPSQEMFIQRSPMTAPVMIAPGTPQWVELLYIVEEFNPEWVSLDIWGENFIIEMAPMAPPPDSPLFEYWEPTMMGGIIVHECLPKDHNTSSWSGPKAFSTPELCPAPTALDATGITANSANLSWTENGSATSWDIEFGATPYSFTGTPTLLGVTNPYPLGGLSSNTEYTYKVRSVCGEVVSNWAGPKVFTTLPTCPAPTGLFANNITTNSANIGWTPVGSESLWNIEWGETGFTLGLGTQIIGVVNNPYTLGGLDPGTEYDFYVQADCGEDSRELSAWAGPYTFETVTLGQTCNAPIVISSVPFTDTDNTSNFGDDYSAADRPPLGGEQYASGTGSGSYLDGDDVVYSITPATNGVYNFNLTDIGTWVGFWLFEGCNPFTSIVAYHTSSAGGTRSLPGINLVGGNTYYIVISTWPAPQSTPYTLTVEKVVPPIPDNLTLTDPITGDDCFNANISVTINGASVEDGASADIRSGGTITATNFEVKSGGTALLKAVTSITLNDGVLITPGVLGYFHASIGAFEPCVLPLAMVASEEVVVPEELPEITSRESFFKVFPNPTTGSFNLELTGVTEETRIIVEVYSMMGDRLLQNELYGMMRYEFNLSELPRGVYLIRVIKGTQMGVERLIKQ